MKIHIIDDDDYDDNNNNNKMKYFGVIENLHDFCLQVNNEIILQGEKKKRTEIVHFASLLISTC